MVSDASPTDTPPPAAGFIGFLTWFEKNKKRLLIGVGAGLAVLFLGIIVVQQQVQKEVNASQALSDVRVPYSAAAPVPAGAVEALLKVAQDHQGTKAAARALLMSATLRFAEQTPSAVDEAQKRFTQLLREYPDSPWGAEANLGLAACLSASGKTNEAIAKYEDIRKRFANSSIITDAKLALASLYETTKPEEAFRLYDELTDQTKNAPGSSAMAEARGRQDELVKRVPELAKLRQPITPPPAPSTASIPINLTNRVASAASNVVVTNLQRVLSTNRAGAAQSIPLKLTPAPAPSPGAPSPATPPATPTPAPPPPAAK
jgi:predicted negative regulator of RcsB-dependent stress response